MTLYKHLRDNSGDESIAKMMWICIIFTVGAILLVLIVGSVKGPFQNWYTNVIHGWFDNAPGNGHYRDSEPTNPFAS